MSKQTLQRAIRRYEGYILSDGTLNMRHLLPKAYDVLAGHNIRSASLKKDILACFNGHTTRTVKSLCAAQYHGQIELRETVKGCDTYYPYDVWESCCDFFNSLAPKGYYFGSYESDGAWVGWFKYNEGDEY